MKKRYSALFLGVSSILLILGYLLVFLAAVPYNEEEERRAEENKERAEMRKEMYEKLE